MLLTPHTLWAPLTTYTPHIVPLLAIDATFIVAITGAVATVGGLLLNLRGQRDQVRERAAAQQALADKGRLEETQQAIDALTGALTSERASNAELRTENRRLEDEIDEQRTVHRQAFAVQETRCREIQTALTDAVITLRSVVLDEVAAAVGVESLNHAPMHPHELLPPRARSTEHHEEQP